MLSLDWDQIDTVLLDMDGTLLDLHYDNHFWNHHLPAQYGLKHGLSGQQAIDKLKPLFQDRAGTLQWYCTTHWSELVEMDIISMKHETADKIVYRPHSEVFLQWAQRAGKDVVMVTNAHDDVLAIKQEKLNLAQYFNALYTSHQFGHAKEEQAFWDALQAKHSFDPKRTVFFDDSLAVLRSAARWGIKHLVAIDFPDSQQPVRDISEFNVIRYFNDVTPL
jgi:putative hydrolase of the HAD superfamily